MNNRFSVDPPFMFAVPNSDLGSHSFAKFLKLLRISHLTYLFANSAELENETKRAGASDGLRLGREGLHYQNPEGKPCLTKGV